MYFVTYISREDRKTLSSLDKKISDSVDPDEKNNLFKERMAIEAKRKPLHECNIEECSDLKSQILEKYQLLASIGKRTQMQQLRAIVGMIQERMYFLTLDMKKEEVDKQKLLDKRGPGRPNAKEQPPRRSKPKAKSLRNKWTLSLEDFD